MFKWTDPKGGSTHILGLSSPPSGRGKVIIRLPLDAAAGDVKGDVPPENCSDFINGSVAGRIRFYPSESAPLRWHLCCATLGAWTVMGGKRSTSLLSIGLQALVAHFGCQLLTDQRVRGWIIEMPLLLQTILRHLIFLPSPVGVCYYMFGKV